MEIKYVLISDGTSDKALLPIIDFTLRKYHKDLSFNGNWADFSRLLKKPKDLSERIGAAIELYDVDILFIHRDAENTNLQIREVEIENAIKNLNLIIKEKKIIKVIPIKMTEAWLLIDETAIRKASGNPNGKTILNVPKVKSLETIKDPKNTLENLITKSSELSPRRLKSLNLRFCIQLVSQHINDFSLLASISSYNHFEAQVKNLKFI